MVSGVLVMLCLASASESLDRARAELTTLDARAAEQSLSTVESALELSRDEVLAFFELKARLEGMRGNDDGARRWFEALLELNPAFELGNRASPKLSVPFTEAREAVSRRGPLGVEITRSERAGLVQELQLRVTGSASRVTTFSASLVEDGVSRAVAPRGLGTTARLPVSGKVIEVQLRLHSTIGWTLLERQVRFEARQVPPPAPVREPEPAPLVVSVAPVSRPLKDQNPARRTAAWLFSGLAVGAGASGGVFFGIGASAENEFNRALEGRRGGYVPITAVHAQALERQVQLGSTGSIISWVSAGAFAVTALTLWLLELGATP